MSWRRARLAEQTERSTAKVSERGAMNRVRGGTATSRAERGSAIAQRAQGPRSGNVRIRLPASLGGGGAGVAGRRSLRFCRRPAEVCASSGAPEDTLPPPADDPFHFGEDSEPNENESCGYVALVGLPNAGKSTISNRLLGQRYSIVTKKPNTTRKRVLGIRSEGDCQLILLDTPGVVTKRANLLDTSMMKAVTTAVEDADAMLMVVDASYEPYETMRLLRPPENHNHVPIAVVVNKIDLVEDAFVDEIKAWVKEEGFAAACVGTCGKTGEGVERVLKWCNTVVPKGPWMYPREIISDHPERFFVAEIVREKLILQYDEEVPYASHVHVLDFKERAKGKDYISVEIAVERESQKKILIGKKGSALKKLATSARLGIEEFLARPVYLEMHVKVHKDWRKSQDEIDSLGLSETA